MVCLELHQYIDLHLENEEELYLLFLHRKTIFPNKHVS
uniref:Uncharacterized protein n=1 Tax=Arundo donax TaxID=35708 RepID=A0A0A9SJ12_ARUDO